MGTPPARLPIKIFVSTAFCSLVVLISAAAPAGAPIDSFTINRLERHEGKTFIFLNSTPQRRMQRVLLASGVEPWGEILPLDPTAQGDCYVFNRSIQPSVAAESLRAWGVPTDFVSTLLPNWPQEGDLLAAVTTVGLGATTAWLNVGDNHGVRRGAHFWQLNAGQPAARFDVLFAGENDCYCRVLPLVAGWQPKVGDQVRLWPSPGLKRAGRAISAVVFVQSVQGGLEIWIAAHPKADVGEETRVEFVREGGFLIGGVVNRRDDRFWYVRIPDADANRIRIGDAARIRTQADRLSKRFAGCVFELTVAGGLIDVGEIDGVQLGDEGRVYRAGETLGIAEIVRTQRTYSVARLKLVDPRNEESESRQSRSDRRAEDERGSSMRDQPLTPAESATQVTESLALGDVVRFGVADARFERFGVIERVRSRILISVRLDRDAPDLDGMLLIRRGMEVIGVAVALAIDGERALIMAVEESLTAEPRAGDLLTTSEYPE